ncbi:MAG: PEGA domain-containing protein [Gammaproteobacteria bacterium]|nr:PEGA domain-containing protein [Gammaproteobacteria bacterium]
MIEQVCISDHKGPRFYTHADFPLSIGSHPNADIEISRESGSSEPAFLIVIVNRAYVDTENSKIKILLNNETVNGQKEIQHDDILEIEDTAFHCELIGNTLSISLYEDDSHLVSRNEAIASDGELIEPIIPSESTVQKKPNRSFLHFFSFIGFLLFGLLAVVLSYIFTAKSLLLEIEPTPDRVALHGKIWPIKVRDRYLVQPGNYFVQVEKSGYQSLKQEIKVSKHQSQTLSFTLVKKPGYLNISSNPIEHVEVTINGKKYGNTPINALELEAGTYTLAASARRYQPYTTQLVIEGKEAKQQLNIELLPDWANVVIDSKPTGAEIWLNGDSKGLTPQTLELDSGQYSLDLRHQDYMPYVKDFFIDASLPFELPVAELFTSPSHLVITSTPTKATVSIAGGEQGITPFTVRLNPNTEHNITLSKPGFRPNQQSVTLKPGEQQNISATLEAILGTVVLNVEPADAEVFINGKFAGNGNVKLSLPSTSQRLEIRKSGYEVYAKMISPEPNAPQVFDISLSRITSTTKVSKPKTLHTSEGQELKLIFGGKFSMGAPRREQGRRSNETLHSVELVRPFYVSVHEITNQQFTAFRNSHDSGSYKSHDLSMDDLPVVNVRWEDAAMYCNWLSEKDGLNKVYREESGTLIAKNPIPTGYRLLTESEWEWVARIQSSNSMYRYEWGNSFPPTQVSGNYADQSAAELLDPVFPDYNDGFIAASPVGSFKANFFGIYDMGGNVAEWCHDYHSIYPSLSDEIFTDPTGPVIGQAIDNKHVIRGASWMRGDLSSTRLSYRDRDNDTRIDVGFRIAKYID